MKIEDGDTTNTGLSDGPQRPTGAGGSVEDAENSGDFERLQDETPLRSWEGEEDFYEGDSPHTNYETSIEMNDDVDLDPEKSSIEMQDLSDKLDTTENLLLTSEPTRRMRN